MSVATGCRSGSLRRLLVGPVAVSTVAAALLFAVAARAASVSPHLPPLPAPLVGARPVSIRSSSPPYTGSLSVPELVWPGHEALAARVDGEIDSWVATEIRRFSAAVTLDLQHAHGLPASLPPSELTLRFQVTRLDAHVASFRLTIEEYLRGMASPSQVPAGLTYDLTTGRPYSLASLFRPGTAYLPLLARLSLQQLHAFAPASHCFVGPGGPPPQPGSFAAWSLSPQGLEIAFPAGRYTAAYCGPPVVTVPFSALRAVAAPGSPAAA
jgi:hypothetical protein